MDIDRAKELATDRLYREHWENDAPEPKSAIDRLVESTDEVLVENLINDGIAFGEGPEAWKQTEEIVAGKLRDCIEAARDKDHGWFKICADNLVNYLVRNMEAMERHRG